MLAAAPPPPPVTKVVTAGAPLSVAGDVPRGAELDRFARHTVTIHPGDRVRWDIRGFHTVTFTPQKATPPAFVIVDFDHPLRGYEDSAGAPYWFNGLPSLRLGEGLTERTPGTTYDGTQIRSSGVPIGSDQTRRLSYALRFPKAGTYRYVCLAHPGSRNVANGMSGVVKVVPRSAPIPTAAQDARAATHEAAEAVARARRLLRWTGPSQPNAVEAGNDRSGITLLRFFPETIRVRTGATVLFSMAPQSLSFHTFSFGPVSYLRPLRQIYKRTRDGRYQVNAPVFFGSEKIKLGSDPAEPPPDYDGRNHGNGFLSPIAVDIDATPASPNPRRVRIRFTRKGTYRYECLIHPGMTGHVVVT